MISMSVILTLLASCVVGYQCAANLQNRLLHPHSCSEASHGLTQYTGERISWTPCGNAGPHPVECSNITVPMDHFNTATPCDKTFTISLIRLRGRDSSQNLLVNPGGPGLSGIETIYSHGADLSELVGDGFHLLSFDPRGINSSTPVASCYPTEEARATLSLVRDGELLHDSPEAYIWAQNNAKACAQTMDEHGAYINTPQTAVDMNSIIDAVGQDDMIYWGLSYGSILGQTYANLFPSRSKRVIIDGIMNIFLWFDKWLSSEIFLNTEDVLKGFFDECIKASQNCSLSSFANSSEHLRKVIGDLSRSLKEEPMPVYINNTLYGMLDYPTLWYRGIFPSLYQPASWYSLAENLAKVLKGNATDAWLAYKRGPTDLSDDANTFVISNDAKSGPKYWPQSRQLLLKEVIADYNTSVFGPSAGAGAYGIPQWVIPRTHNFTPEERVKTAHPLLILSTTYDPIAPLSFARLATSVFEDSRLVIREGYGHMSLSVPSTCMATRIREFLYNGMLPENNTKCKIDAPYFIKPEVDKKQTVRRDFSQSDEQRIHLAQLGLARDWQW